MLRTAEEGKKQVGEWGAGPGDMSLGKARVAAVAVLEKAPAKAKGGTFGEAIEKYIEQALPADAETTRRDWRWRFGKYIKPALKDAPLDDGMAFRCGFRVGTAQAREWSWYDEDEKVLLIPSPGTEGRASEDRAIAFPVVKAVAEAFKLQRKITGEQTLINGNLRTEAKRKSIQKSAWKLREAVPDFRPHDVRRYVRSTLSRLDVSPDTAERVLLHKLRGVRGVYDAWCCTKQIRAALELFETHLDGVLAEARHRRYAERQEAWAEWENHQDPEGE